MRKAILILVLSLAPFIATAEPNNNIPEPLQKFIAAFNAGSDVGEIIGLFAPDAEFWGTTMPELGTSSEAIRKYFAASFASRATTPATASILSSSTNAVSENVVLVAGRWQVERNGSAMQLRFTVVLQRRDGAWKIVQFHSSPRPNP